MPASDLNPTQSIRFSASIRLFVRRILGLFREPVFIALTIFGNLVIALSSISLYHLEHGVNPHIQTFLDALWWSVSTVTTVGYGDITPITQVGRVLGIITMIVGSALFWSFTALFAEALLSHDIFDLEIELRALGRNLSRIQKSDIQNQSETKQLIESLEAQVQSLKQKLN